METQHRSLLNPLPWAVWALLLPVAGVEAVLLAAQAGLVGGPEGIGWRIGAIQRLGFSGALMDHVLATRRFTHAHIWRPLSYPLVQFSWLQTVFVLVLLAALGRAVGQVLSGPALLAVALGASAGGALAYGAAFAEPFWLVGGYPMVFGLLGAFAVLIWKGQTGTEAPRMRALGLVGALLVLRLGVGLTLGTGQEWLADLAAFAIGLLLSLLLAPGGGRALLQRLRRA